MDLLDTKWFLLLIWAESVFADELHALGYGHVFQFKTFEEGAVADGFQTFRQDDVFEFVAIHKSSRPDGFQVL